MALRLETPGAEHRERYEEMMEEWEGYGGRLNPGAMRRRSEKHPEPISYEAWMAWLEEDREAGQELFFLVETETGRLLGASASAHRWSGRGSTWTGTPGTGYGPASGERAMPPGCSKWRCPYCGTGGLTRW